ncbi:hypothetical protein RHMOL_Rhmol10G0154100 [Rhododendron molle]|uniref:Uncharacterized protein n=2 Tax=Rhododendron molle TaxID=49168 RepID=A0ACC0M3Q0_RHOML|nr:hypothetical protein RHMOL_Rhmol10G0154100 [Rhododendron molle]KAI8535176.1 hypothetical protein RHMOL_Rhmol10G0154100 [Rhododendron molle]
MMNQCMLMFPRSNDTLGMEVSHMRRELLYPVHLLISHKHRKKTLVPHLVLFSLSLFSSSVPSSPPPHLTSTPWTSPPPPPPTRTASGSPSDNPDPKPIKDPNPAGTRTRNPGSTRTRPRSSSSSSPTPTSNPIFVFG